MLAVRIAAVGTDRAGPFRGLVDDYRQRFDRVGRGVGLGPPTVEEVEGRGGTPAPEAVALRAALPRASMVVTGARSACKRERERDSKRCGW